MIAILLLTMHGVFVIPILQIHLISESDDPTHIGQGQDRIDECTRG